MSKTSRRFRIRLTLGRKSYKAWQNLRELRAFTATLDRRRRHAAR